MADSNSTLSPDLIPIRLPNMTAFIKREDLREAQGLGRQLLDVVETAIAAFGDIETDSGALWAAVATSRALLDAEHIAGQG